MGRSIVFARLDDELVRQVEDLKQKFDFSFEQLLSLLLQRFYESELELRQKKEIREI